MIDSHCHLDREPLISNLSQVLTRAKDVGLKKLLTICTTNSGYNDILDIVSKDPMIYGTFGIHPHETKNYFVEKACHLTQKSRDRTKFWRSWTRNFKSGKVISFHKADGTKYFIKENFLSTRRV